MSKAKLNGESRVSEYLSSIGLRIERFSKAEMRKGRTPDFRVFGNGELAFYCEVKTKQEDEWLARQQAAAPLGLAGGERLDPTCYRVVNHIHSAVGQFDAVNAGCQFPNVLAFVNHDFEADIRDLIGVLTGNAYSDSDSILPCYRNYSEGRIREEKRRIHLYLWFDVDEQEPRKFWMQSHNAHHSVLCGCLGIDPALIKQI